MKRFDSKRIGIDEGEAVLFSDFDSGGVMWTGSGARTRRHAVRFESGFTSPPAVHCALSMWDIDSDTNSRVDIGAENITETGFDVTFTTWGNTRVARARVRWLAIGEVAHEDDWHLY
jgi:hypothetical protein